MTWDLVIEQIQFAFFGLLFAVITTGSRPQINVNVDASTIYRFDELIRKGLIPSVSTLIIHCFNAYLHLINPFHSCLTSIVAPWEPKFQQLGKHAENETPDTRIDPDCTYNYGRSERILP